MVRRRSLDFRSLGIITDGGWLDMRVFSVGVILVCLILVGCWAYRAGNVEYKSWEFDGGYTLYVPAEFPDIDDLECLIYPLGGGVYELDGYLADSEEISEAWRLILYRDGREVKAWGVVYTHVDYKLGKYYIFDEKRRAVRCGSEEFTDRFMDFMESRMEKGEGGTDV